MKMTQEELQAAIKIFTDNKQNYNIAASLNPLTGQIFAEISVSLDNGGPQDAADIKNKKALVQAQLIADLQTIQWT